MKKFMALIHAIHARFETRKPPNLNAKTLIRFPLRPFLLFFAPFASTFFM
jgi:hypothetical protein